MFFALRKSSMSRQHARWAVRLVLAMSLTLAAGGVAAQSALAAGTPFQRGDVFLAGGGGVQEYSPSGQLLQTVAGSAGAGALCFSPNGTRLIVPGVGLFDSSGNLLSSNLASVPSGRCVADGFGHAYVSAGFEGVVPYSITKYDIGGNLLQTFNITELESHTLAIDLAPDECTIYYGSWGIPSLGVISRLNVCTNTQEPSFTHDRFVDDLRVLPDWRVLKTDDTFATLYDASGQGIRSYKPAPGGNDNGDGLRTLSLDPHGTSFWVCCTWVRPDITVAKVFRFDISSGQLLAAWAPDWTALGPNPAVALYGPPLLGNANVGNNVDSNTSGTAEAFVTKARFSGQMTRLHLWLDSSSTASQAVVGIYSNRDGDPGALQAQATITNPRAGSWNYVDIPSIPVTAGQRYWIAVLGPVGAGKIRFRDALSGAGSETSARHDLTALPARWSTGKTWATGKLSAYGS